MYILYIAICGGISTVYKGYMGVICTHGHDITPISECMGYISRYIQEPKQSLLFRCSDIVHRTLHHTTHHTHTKDPPWRTGHPARPVATRRLMAGGKVPHRLFSSPTRSRNMNRRRMGRTTAALPTPTQPRQHPPPLKIPTLPTPPLSPSSSRALTRSSGVATRKPRCGTGGSS